MLASIPTVSLNYIKSGERGPPLIIMHGLFGSARNWQAIANKLSDNYSVYALDLRNHGASAHHDDMSYPAMAADVARFLEQHDLHDAILLGHSMGGKVAMYLALTEPERVKQLIVVDIAPVAYQHDFDDILQALRNVPLKDVKSRKEADVYLAKKLEVLSLRQFLLQNLVPSTAGGYQWRVHLDSIEDNLSLITGFPVLGKNVAYDKAACFIAGGKSTYLSSAHQLKTLAYFPKASIHSISGSGHWPHIEAPSQFMAHLDNFLKFN